MKNLKRVLSLGLASVMLLGMMVVGASAKDFTDAEDIVHSEAVQVMVALNIINGKEDGSYFAPKDTVTRGEMAKMIAVAMNGGSESNTGVKTTPSFTDIGGHWAEGWIEYCADMKIINGRGDGTFDPNGTVTGVEALKMVLTALGYEAEAYGLTGAGWAAQTIERARQTGFVKLVNELADVTLTAPATRDVAAQMIWNGLQAEAVTTTPSQNKSNGETTWIYDSTGVSLLTQRYDANIFTGVFQGNWNTGIGGDKGEITIYGYNKDGEAVASEAVKVVSDLDIDNIGEEVKVVWKDSSKGTKGSLDPKDTIYGVFNTGATRVVRSQLSKVKWGDKDKDILNIDGTKYDTDPTKVQLITNFDVANAADKSANGVASGTNYGGTLAAALKKNSGYPIKVTFNEDGKVDKVYVTETYIGVVTATNSTNINISGDAPCNLKIADHDVEEGLKKGDVVAVTPYYTTNPNSDDDKVVVSVKKAEVVSGELVSGKADETLTLDSGKDYKINYQNKGAKYKLLSIDIPDNDGKVVNSFPFADDNDYIGDDFDLYLVNGYVMAAVQTSKSASNYSVVIEVKEGKAGATFGGLQLRVLTADGSKEIITVAKPSKGTLDETNFGVGDIITYTFNSDDEAEVELRAAAASTTTVSYDDKAKSLKIDSGDKVVTSGDCVLFVQTEIDTKDKPLTWSIGADVVEKAEWKVYNIRNLDGDDWTSDISAAYKDDNGRIVAAVINLNETPAGASDDTVYAIISKYVKKEKDYYVYTAQSNGEEYTLKIKNENKDQIKEAMLVTFNPTADDTYKTTDVKQMNNSNGSAGKDGTWATGFVKEYSSKDRTLTLWVGEPEAKKDDKGNNTGVWEFDPDDNEGANTYALDKDAQIIYVDLDGKKSTGESAVNAYSQLETSDASKKEAFANVGYVIDDEDVIQVLFVEISGKKGIK